MTDISWLILSSKYSKALRSTFFGERKNSCSSKFVQLLLLNRVKARWSKNRAAQGFHYINSFSSNFFGPNSKTSSCKVRASCGCVFRGLTIFIFWCSSLKFHNLRIQTLEKEGMDIITNVAEQSIIAWWKKTTLMSPQRCQKSCERCLFT